MSDSQSNLFILVSFGEQVQCFITLVSRTQLLHQQFTSTIAPHNDNSQMLQNFKMKKMYHDR